MTARCTRGLHVECRTNLGPFDAELVVILAVNMSGDHEVVFEHPQCFIRDHVDGEQDVVCARRYRDGTVEVPQHVGNAPREHGRQGQPDPVSSTVRVEAEETLEHVNLTFSTCHPYVETL